MRDQDELFQALARSPFRRRFRLCGREREYARTRGVVELMRHAETLVDARLAGARPANDGRQTPLRGHPVFVAQHATATCCRSCLRRWHGIVVGRPLTPVERVHVLAVIRRWLVAQGVLRSPAP